MTDYLFLKISEMALRAIRGISDKTWVCIGYLKNSNSGYRSVLMDRYPKYIIRKPCGLVHVTYEVGTIIYDCQREHHHEITIPGEGKWYDRVEFL